MTTSELLRALADETERREHAEQRIAELESQLQQTTQAKPPATLLNVQEAARYIRRHPSWLHKDRLASPPRIPYIQECARGPVTYRRADLDSYLELRVRGRKKTA